MPGQTQTELRRHTRHTRDARHTRDTRHAQHRAMATGHVLQLFQPDVGGVPNYVASLAEGLRERGWNLTVAAPSDTPVLERLRNVADRTIPLDTQAGAAPKTDARLLGELLTLCRQTRVQLIHAHSSKAGALAAVVGMASGIPTVYTPHSWSFQRELPRVAARAYVTVERLLGRRHARVIAVTDAERAEAERTKVVDPARVQLVHTGLRDAVLPDRAWARSQLGLAPDAFVVGWVGRLGAQKRAEHLPLLSRELLGKAQFAVLGFGMPDSPIGSELTELGAVVSESAAPELIYAAADAVAVTSRWEGLPLVTLEAMRASLPVVGYDVGGLPEQIEHGVTGYLVESGDLAGMASRLEELADDPDKTARMGSAARERFLSRFNFGRMISRIEETYRQVSVT